MAEVASVGGYVKEYRIEVDPNKLISYGIPIDRVIAAVKSSNLDVGAEIVEEGAVEFVVCGIEYLYLVPVLFSIYARRVMSKGAKTEHIESQSS